MGIYHIMILSQTSIMQFFTDIKILGYQTVPLYLVGHTYLTDAVNKYYEQRKIKTEYDNYFFRGVNVQSNIIYPRKTFSEEQSRDLISNILTK